MHPLLNFSMIVQLNARCRIDLWAELFYLPCSPQSHTHTIGQYAFLRYDAILFNQVDCSGINLATSFLLLLD